MGGVNVGFLEIGAIEHALHCEWYYCCGYTLLQPQVVVVWGQLGAVWLELAGVVAPIELGKFSL